ncbi:uncharacterized [Tachysurus ichikawai]
MHLYHSLYLQTGEKHVGRSNLIGQECLRGLQLGPSVSFSPPALFITLVLDSVTLRGEVSDLQDTGEQLLSEKSELQIQFSLLSGTVCPRCRRLGVEQVVLIRLAERDFVPYRPFVSSRVYDSPFALHRDTTQAERTTTEMSV